MLSNNIMDRLSLQTLTVGQDKLTCSISEYRKIFYKRDLVVETTEMHPSITTVVS